jgi:hypothetical protein
VKRQQPQQLQALINQFRSLNARDAKLVRSALEAPRKRGNPGKAERHQVMAIYFWMIYDHDSKGHNWKKAADEVARRFDVTSKHAYTVAKDYEKKGAREWAQYLQAPTSLLTPR